MPHLLGRDAVVARTTAAVERARLRGGGTIAVSGPAGVGTTVVVQEALSACTPKVSRASGSIPADAEALVWWIDDAQRMRDTDAERLSAGISDDATRVIVLSGRRPLGGRLAPLVRQAMRVDPAAVIDVDALDGSLAVAAVASAPEQGAGGVDRPVRRNPGGEPVSAADRRAHG